jgi:NADH:ubiquinone oxidoreductase subunit
MPINLLALGLLVHGMVFQGVLLEVFAKLFGTLFISRVFSLTKRQLITYKIINSTYTLISRWLAWAHRKVVETPIYKKAKIIKVYIRNYFKND